MQTMNSLWEDAKSRGTEVVHNRVVYRGVVFQKEETTLRLLSGQSTFYDELSDDEIMVFLEKGVIAGTKYFLTKKYKALIDRCGVLIQDELSTRRNQKRIEFLKKQRDGYTQRIAAL